MRVLVSLVARLPALIVGLPLPFLALVLALAGQSAVIGRPTAWHGWLLLGGGAALLGLASRGVGRRAAPAGAPRAPAAPDADTVAQPPIISADEAALSAPDPAPERLIGGLSGLAALLLVTLVAAAFRLPWLHQLPPGLAAEEAQLGLDAARVLASGWSASAWGGWPIFHLLTVGSVATFGQTVLALRVPAALAGIAFAPAMYLLGRQLGGTRLGLVAGLLGAVTFWHADFSRGAWGYLGWGLAAETFGLALMLRTFRRPDPVLTAVAGIAFGLALQVSWAALAAMLAGALLLMMAPGVTFRTRRFLPNALAPFLVYFAVAAGPVLLGVCVPDQRPAPQAPTLAAASAGTGGPAAVADSPAAPASTPAAVAATTSPTPLAAAARLLLLFNVAGDRSPLHSLHAEPVLDLVTGVLLILGLGVAVARWRSAQLGAILAWLAAALIHASLISRAPAPDSLAAVHALAPVLLLAAVAVTAIAGGLHRHTKLATGWSLDVAALMLLIIVGINAHSLYIRRPADVPTWAAYAADEVLATREIRRLTDTHTIYLADVWIDHPTIRYLLPELAAPQRIDPARTLPFPDDHTFAYFAPGSQEVIVEDLERLYENGEIDRFASPVEDDVAAVRSFRAPAKVVAEARGVTVRTYPANRSNAGRLTLPTYDLQWPVPGEPQRALALELYSAVTVVTPGSYRFRMDGPPGAVLEVNGVTVGGPGQEITAMLAGGSQRVRVTAQVDGPAQIGVRWAPPGSTTLVSIPSSQLYREQRAALGVLAFYRPGTAAEAAPQLAQVERYLQRAHLPPALARPYVVDWVGTVDAPKSGTYRIKIDASGPASLWIDDRPVMLDAPPGSEPISMILPEGDHRIQARLVDIQGPTRFDLQWAPPGEDFGAVPTLRLRPPDTRVEAVALTGQSQEPPLLPLGEPRVLWLASTEGEPRAVAVRPDGTVFLADAGSRRVQQVIGEGRELDSLPVSFGAPSDLAIGPDGSLWVLDAQRGQIVRLAENGTPAQTISNTDLGLYQPRGLAISPDGTIWIADTGGSRVLKLAQDGTVLESIGPDIAGPEPIRQPTDVAVGPDGELFVVNGEGGALIRLTPDGVYERHWAVLPADTERGSHLAIGADRSLWVSEPNGRRISRFTFDGTPSGVFDLLRDVRLLRVPVGIAIGPDGTLYVADTSLRAIVALTFRR